MLVFLYIFLFIIILSIILYFSYVKIEIERVKVNSTQKPIINDYKVKISLSFLNRIKYLKISIYKEKMDKAKLLNFKNIKEKLVNNKFYKSLKQKGLIQNKDLISKAIKDINMHLDQFSLRTEIGFYNVIIVSYITAIIDIIISILLAKNINNRELVEKYRYEIIPKQTKNLYIDLTFNAIFSIKISNIIKKSCNLKKIKV